MTSLKLLFSRNYGLWWWTGFVSDAGTWMQTVAIGALVTELTDSAGWGSLTVAVAYLMTGVSTPFAGVLADNHDRRRMLVIAALAGAVVATVLAIVYAAGQASPVFIVVATAFEGLLMAANWPVRNSLLPQVVSDEELPDAIALGPASWNLGRAIGPAIAGIIIVNGSYTWIFVANAVSFFVVAAGVQMVRLRPHHFEKSSAGVFTRMREGVVAVKNEPGCRLALMVMALVALTVSPFIALVPAMSQIVLDGRPVDTTHLVIAQGVGAILGALTYGTFVSRFGTNVVTKVTVIGSGLALIGYAASPSLTVAVAWLVVIGFLYCCTMVSLNTIVQMRAIPAFKGRAVSLFVTTLSVFYPLGAAFQGWLGDIVGVRQVLAGGAVILLVVSVSAMVLARDALSDLDHKRSPEPVRT